MPPLSPPIPHEKAVKELRLLLELSPRSVLIFCLYRSPEDIDRVQQELEQALDIPIQRKLLNHKQLNPLRLVTELPPEPRQAVFAQYEGGLNQELTTCAGYANIQRDVLNTVNHALVMWFREEAFARFIRQAPDFWAWHSAVLEFQSSAPATAREALIDMAAKETELSPTDRANLTARSQSYQDLINVYNEPKSQDLPYFIRLHLRLADSLYDLTDYEAALETIQEAERLLDQIEDDELRGILCNLKGITLSNLGRRENALAAIEEAVETYRNLAQARPDDFLPDLARSLGVRGVVLQKSNQVDEAGASFKEGVELLAPYFTRYPQAFESLMNALLSITSRPHKKPTSL